MRLIKISTIVLLALAPFTFVFAEQTGIRLSIGPFYRNFDDIEFNGTVDFPPVGISNFANATSNPTASGFGIQGYTSLPNSVGQRVPIDYVNDGGGRSKNGVDTSDRWGPTIGLEMDIVDNVDTIVSFVGNFSFFSVQGGGNTSLKGFTISHLVVQGGAISPVFPAQYNENTPSSANIFVDSDFDLELYVLDIGLKSKFTYNDPLIFSVAAGPTLSIGDATSEQTARASWDPIFGENDPGQRTGITSRKSDVDFIFGLYAAVEAEYRLNESISLALGWRYDYASQEAGTSQAELDLETHGAYAKLFFDF